MEKLYNRSIQLIKEFLNEMKELVPDDRFLDASWRMTEAWKRIVGSGQLRKYSEMSKEDIDTLKEKDSSDKENEYIIQYLMAMQDLLEILKT